MKHLTPILCMVLASGCQIPLALQEPGAGASSGYWGPFASGEESPAEAQRPSQVAPAPEREAQPTVAQDSAEQVPMPSSAAVEESTARSADAPLLDWSGGVVDAPRAGTVQEVSRVGSRGLQESVEGRMHIIELYQSVLDERDQLLTEVDALQAALEKAQTQLQAEHDQSASLTTRIDALEEAKRRLMEENAELASRLTTAQLRRLEAEKLLLETQIAWHQEKSEAAARSVADRIGNGGSR